MKTLEEKGTPWAESYRGSGRLNGRLAAQPVYCQNGDVAPGWSYVGELNSAEFNSEFEAEQHDHCHDSSHPDFSCSLCQAAGWVD